MSRLNIIEGVVNGKLVDVMRDSGSTGCTVRRSLVNACQYTGRKIRCRLIDGSLLTVPEAVVDVQCRLFTGRVEAAVMKSPLRDFILGNVGGVRDRCGVDATTQTVAAMTRSMARAKESRQIQLRVPSVPDLMNSSEVKRDQRVDPSLEVVRGHLRDNAVRTSKGKQTSFIERNGKIYRKLVLDSGEVQMQFVVPEKYRHAIFQLGHVSPMAGHMGARKTVERISREYFWPGMTTEIDRLARSCDACQKTTDRGRVPPAPLRPLPIISTPFERVAVDIVGPINPRSSDGYKYILTLVDFSTRWPEAVALKNIETTTVAEALLGIFSRVGFPRQILSDRGTQFTSAMMDELLRLLSVEGLRTTPYHPQCNGLCERFNGTLKKMLRRMTAEQPKEWPWYIAPLLFAYREAPQSSLKFSPFELVYGRTVRGPLQVLRELWDEVDPDPNVQTTYEYVLNLSERLKTTCDLAKEELTKAQEVQKSYFDKRAKLRVFEPGDKCLILLPTSHNKLLATWQGPFNIRARVSDTNYLVQVDGQRAKRYHVNMLKRYVESGAVTVAGAQECERQFTSVGREFVSAARSPEQLACLRLVRARFQPHERDEIFSAVVINGEENDGIGPITAETAPQESCHDVVMSEELSAEQGRQVKQLCVEYGRLFCDKPRVARVPSHTIELISQTPVKVKPYPIPLRLMSKVKHEIEVMVEAGIIEKSVSPYCSPLVVAAKKTGEVRLCGDYRQVNAKTKIIAEPMSDQRLIFTRLAKSKYFTKLDLTKGYFQIPLELRSQEITAFVTPWGLYQYRVLPFGLTNAPAVFNCVMREVFQDIPGVEIFVDDVLIHTAEFGEHLRV